MRAYTDTFTKPKLSELGYRVTLQGSTVTTTSGGLWSIGWETGTTCWANVEARSWSEVDGNGKMQQYTEWLITMRQRPVQGRRYRVLHDNRYLTVKAVLSPWRDGEFIMLMCEEEVGVTDG